MANENQTQATSQSGVPDKEMQLRYVKKEAMVGKDQFRVILLKEHNPKKAGSKSAVRFEWYLKHAKENPTVADVLRAAQKFAKGEASEPSPRADDLRWDLAHGFIRLESPDGKPVGAAEASAAVASAEAKAS